MANISAAQVRYLKRIAEGRAKGMSESTIGKLKVAGLVEESNERLRITAKGKEVLKKHDQNVFKNVPNGGQYP